MCDRRIRNGILELRRWVHMILRKLRGSFPLDMGGWEAASPPSQYQVWPTLIKWHVRETNDPSVSGKPVRCC